VKQPFKKRFKKRERASYVCMYLGSVLVITYMHCKKRKKKIAFSCREEKMNAISPRK